MLYYGATTQQKEPALARPPAPPPVRRVFETWRWTYARDAAREPQTYNINYRVEGEGPPVLLVHGFGANVNHFRHQFPALTAAGYRVYAIDLLGFGASDKPSAAATIGFSIDLFVRQLSDFCRAMQAEHPRAPPWTLAGNSIGGLCCLGLAAQLEQNPDLLSEISISSIVLFNTSGGMTGFRYEDVPCWSRPLLAFVQHVVLGPVCGGYFFRNFRTRANVERILKESGVYGDITNVDEELLEILLAPADDPGAEQVFLAVFGGPAGPTAESLLPRIRVPVLALWGEKDPWTPVTSGLHPGDALPPYHGSGRFTLDVLPGAGHCPHDECYEIVNAKMLAFLQKVAQSAADDAGASATR